MIATQPQTKQTLFYQTVLANYSSIAGRIDPITVLDLVSKDVVQFNMRQQNSNPIETNLQKIWEWRQKLSKLGLLVLDKRERTWPEFFRFWRQIRLDRDLSHETMDAATLLRTIFSRHDRAKDLSPFWFIFPADYSLPKVFVYNARLVFSPLQADLIQASALRSAPPEKLIQSIDYLMDQKNKLIIETDVGRLICLSMIREMQRRLRESGLKYKSKPAYHKSSKLTNYLTASEYAYAKELALVLPGKGKDDVWKIGNERYLATNPISNARKNATKLFKTGDQQGVMGFAVAQEGRIREAVRGQQGRDVKGRWDRDRTNAQTPVRAFVGKGEYTR